MKNSPAKGMTLVELLVVLAIIAIVAVFASGNIKKAFTASDENQLNSELSGFITDGKILKDAKGYGDGKAGVNLMPSLIAAGRVPTSTTVIGGVPMNSVGGSYTLESTAGGLGYKVGTNKLSTSLCISAATTQSKSGVPAVTTINSTTFSGSVSRNDATTACSQTENSVSFSVNG